MAEDRLPWAEDVQKKIKSDVNAPYQVSEIIGLGAEICGRIKKIYPATPWREMDRTFSYLKSHAKKFYPGISDIDLLLKIRSFSDEDISEAIGDVF